MRTLARVFAEGRAALHACCADFPCRAQFYFKHAKFFALYMAASISDELVKSLYTLMRTMLNSEHEGIFAAFPPKALQVVRKLLTASIDACVKGLCANTSFQQLVQQEAGGTTATVGDLVLFCHALPCLPSGEADAPAVLGRVFSTAGHGYPTFHCTAVSATKSAGNAETIYAFLFQTACEYVNTLPGAEHTTARSTF